MLIDGDNFVRLALLTFSLTFSNSLPFSSYQASLFLSINKSNSCIQLLDENKVSYLFNKASTINVCIENSVPI